MLAVVRTVGPGVPRLSSNGLLHLRAPRVAAPTLDARRGHNIKAPGVPWNIYHPHILEPERTAKIKGSKSGDLAKFVPKNFKHQQYVESIRTGEYLGPDWPYNFLGGTQWKARRYNVSYNAIPPDMSPAIGVTFYPRLNVWASEWHEQETQRVRWFRAQYGFVRAREAAEDFRKKLIEAGRVDNKRTERQIRLQALAGKEERYLRKKKFARKDARRVGNSGTKMGPERKVREDYKKRGLLP
eukprot:gnl/TRDRNA2_/TRDRNA2_85329_c0_seq1.p1 gnl/TRDRNA2_/TRDRNA2_85329_c0~~gnl/TRDRNA2_/TRDRNA2_85329_c0_seq1.p1  ORF type:complete len:267 (+),score=33.38 gnl/TRDRNA2_/TRDRNA2_85329_c0_seq1:79-801(+)